MATSDEQNQEQESVAQARTRRRATSRKEFTHEHDADSERIRSLKAALAKKTRENESLREEKAKAQETVTGLQKTVEVQAVTMYNAIGCVGIQALSNHLLLKSAMGVSASSGNTWRGLGLTKRAICDVAHPSLLPSVVRLEGVKTHHFFDIDPQRVLCGEPDDGTRASTWALRSRRQTFGNTHDKSRFTPFMTGDVVGAAEQLHAASGAWVSAVGNKRQRAEADPDAEVGETSMQKKRATDHVFSTCRFLQCNVRAGFVDGLWIIAWLTCARMTRKN